MKTSLIVTTYDWKEALDVTFRSIARQVVMPDEVIVADDGSRADTGDLVRAWAARLPVPVLHVWQEHAGFRLARSRNRAIAAATGEYLVFVDGDMLLHRRFVADHQRAARTGCFVQGTRAYSEPAAARRILAGATSECGFLTRGVRRRHRALRCWPLAWLIHRRAHANGRWIQGCNQGYWKSDLIRVNGYDERMTHWGREDDELAARLFHAGVLRRDLRFAAGAVHVYHPSRNPPGPNPNDRYLFETLQGRRTWCAQGLDQHLPAPGR